jgi:hypothetical protein
LACRFEAAVGLHIEFERSGGFAGVVLRTSVDSSELPREEAAELEALVARASLPGLAARSGGSPPAPDRFQYVLTILRDGRTQRIRFSERDVTPELRPLLDRLLDLARRR